MCNVKMAYDKYLTACVYNLISLLACLYGVLSTCRPPGEFAELSMCAEASQTGRALFIDVAAVPDYSPAICRCSVNISQSARDIQVSYSYQGPTSPCRSGFQFSLANISLTCNVTSISVDNFDEINFAKETSDQIDYTCLILYIDRGVSENETNATASVSCFENSVDSTTSDITDQSTSITTTDSEVITSTVFSEGSSSGSVSDSWTGSSPLTSQSAPITTEKDVVFKEFIIIAVVAGVAGALLIIVLIAIIISCCRHQHTKATYDVKRGQLNAESPSADSEMTEHAFYNMALVNNPTYY